MARVAALDRDSGDAGRVDCVIDPPTGARMFKLLPVTVADRKAVYRLVTDDEAEFDREVLVYTACLRRSALYSQLRWPK